MPDLVIEPKELNALIQNNSQRLLIVDLGQQERYLNAHIPGAVLVTPAQTQAGPPIPGFAPSDEQLTALFQSIGLQDDTYVIVYDDEGGGWAGRFIWLLDEIGHTRYSYLNGGLHAWAAEEFELASGAEQIETSSLKIKLSGAHSIDKDSLTALLPLKTDTQIWDARSPMEHSGEKAFAARGGRIPGAINYEWTRAMDQNNHLRLKPKDTLLAELEQCGISPDKHTITHCQTHHRSGLTYLIAKHLNFKSIKAYPGSWGEWGNNPETPVETG